MELISVYKCKYLWKPLDIWAWHQPENSLPFFLGSQREKYVIDGVEHNIKFGLTALLLYKPKKFIRSIISYYKAKKIVEYLKSIGRR